MQDCKTPSAGYPQPIVGVDPRQRVVKSVLRMAYDYYGHTEAGTQYKNGYVETDEFVKNESRSVGWSYDQQTGYVVFDHKNIDVCQCLGKNKADVRQDMCV